MPFYEYECQACKYYTEVMQKISDPPLRKCPSCSKLKLKKLLSAPVFRLKGGGWYETDFKSDKESRRNLAGPEGESSTASDSTAENAKPADAKPADAKAGESKTADSKPADTKPETKSPEKSPEKKPAASSSRKSSSRAKPKSPIKAKSKSPARKARR